MAKYKYNGEVQKVWEKAPYCNCGRQDCTKNNHRLCGICSDTIMYGAHESVKSQNNSKYAWNIDHRIPKSKDGSNSIKNKQVVHIQCNRNKANR